MSGDGDAASRFDAVPTFQFQGLILAQSEGFLVKSIDRKSTPRS
jgi:hypothetical protein